MADQRQSIPQDPEARALIVGATIAGDYAIAAWSNVLMWPAKQAPYCKKSSAPRLNPCGLTTNRGLHRQVWLGSWRRIADNGNHHDVRVMVLGYSLLQVCCKGPVSPAIHRTG